MDLEAWVFIFDFKQNGIFIANHEFAGRTEQFEPSIITSSSTQNYVYIENDTTENNVNDSGSMRGIIHATFMHVHINQLQRLSTVSIMPLTVTSYQT